MGFHFLSPRCCCNIGSGQNREWINNKQLFSWSINVLPTAASAMRQWKKKMKYHIKRKVRTPKRRRVEKKKNIFRKKRVHSCGVIFINLHLHHTRFRFIFSACACDDRLLQRMKWYVRRHFFVSFLLNIFTCDAILILAHFKRNIHIHLLHLCVMWLSDDMMIFTWYVLEPVSPPDQIQCNDTLNKHRSRHRLTRIAPTKKNEGKNRNRNEGITKCQR